MLLTGVVVVLVIVIVLMIIAMRSLGGYVNELASKVVALENRTKSHGDKIKNVEKAVGNLDERIGSSGYSPYTRSLFDIMSPFYDYGPRKREAKPFNLTQKVQAIMTHLGLTEEISAETKLVKVSKEKKK